MTATRRGPRTRTALRAAVALLTATAGLAVAPSPAGAATTETSVTLVGNLYAQPWTHRLTPDNAAFQTVTDARAVRLTMDVAGGNSYTVSLGAPEGQQLAVGTYDDTVRFWGHPDRPGRPWLSVSGEGQGCNDDTGSFRVLDVGFTDGKVSRLWATYAHACGNTDVPTLVGEIKLNVPAADDVAVANQALDFAKTYPGLDRHAPVWLTNNGTAPLHVSSVTIAGADTFRVVYSTCATVAAGATCVALVEYAPTTPGALSEAVLTFGSAAGSHTAALSGRAIPGRTAVSIRSDAGDYVGAGGSYDYTPVNATTGMRVDALAAGDVLVGGVHQQSSGQSWGFTFHPADGQPLAPGTYADSEAQDSTEPWLSVTGLGRGCNMTTGTFTIHDIVYVAGGPSIERLLLTFDQRCVGSAAHLKGSIAYRAPLDSADPDITAPAPVTGLKIVPGFSGNYRNVSLSWKASTSPDVVKYAIRMKVGLKSPSAHTSGTWVGSGPELTAWAYRLEPGVTYTFAVYALDAAGNPSPPTWRTMHATQLTLTAAPAQVQYGRYVDLAATPVRVDGQPGPGSGSVTFFWRGVDEPGFATPVGTVDTGADGTATLRVYPRAHGEYLAVFAGTVDEAIGSVATPVPVRVSVRVSSGLSRTVVAPGGETTLSGGVAPMHTGHRVYLQRRIDGVWRTMTYRVLADDNRYAFRIRPRANGTYEYRVLLPGHADHDGGYSHVRSFTVG